MAQAIAESFLSVWSRRLFLCVQVFTKSGAEQQLLRRALDLKRSLEAALQKHKELHIDYRSRVRRVVSWGITLRLKAEFVMSSEIIDIMAAGQKQKTIQPLCCVEAELLWLWTVAPGWQCCCTDQTGTAADLFFVFKRCQHCCQPALPRLTQKSSFIQSWSSSSFIWAKTCCGII